MTIAVPSSASPATSSACSRPRSISNISATWCRNLKIGQAGYSYVISRSGELIAHPDISLVLQRRNVLKLESTKAAFIPAAERPKRQALVTPNVQGKNVLTASAQVNGLEWAVIVDRPVEEAYEPLYASVFRTSTVLLFGLGLALMASLFIGRRVVRPLGILREGVERIGKGDLGHRLDLKTGDEIEVLADEFNKMTIQLQESYANLEQKVEDRTKELTESLGATDRDQRDPGRHRQLADGYSTRPRRRR